MAVPFCRGFKWEGRRRRMKWQLREERAEKMAVRVPDRLLIFLNASLPLPVLHYKTNANRRVRNRQQWRGDPGEDEEGQEMIYIYLCPLLKGPELLGNTNTKTPKKDGRRRRRARVLGGLTSWVAGK
jgi:hypothetical protein